MVVLSLARSEALLRKALAAREIEPERGVELTSFSQNNNGVDAVLTRADRSEDFRAPLSLAAAKLTETLGIRLKGSDLPEAWPLYDLQVDDPLESAHVSFVKGGMKFILCIGLGLWRVFGNVGELLACLPPDAKPGAIGWQSSFHISFPPGLARPWPRRRSSVALHWPVMPPITSGWKAPWCSLTARWMRLAVMSAD